MNTLRTLRLALACVGATLLAPSVMADDIDIFVGTSGGTADAPNIMFLVDNSPNWSRAAQHWPDAPTQGQAEVAAISQLLTYLATQNVNINVGLAELSANSGGNGTGGGYIRFAARNMSVSANKTALQNILSIIYNNINSPSEKLSGQSSKDETAGIYEVYKYFSGLAPYSGALAANAYADVGGNLGGGVMGSSGVTAYGQNQNLGGWAIVNGSYQSPISSTHNCASNYIIYIANNASGTASTGPFENVYQPSVIPALSALPASAGDTWTDEWTRYLYQTGAQVPAGNTNGTITTYVLDAYNAQNNAGYSASLQAAARQGGGRYFQVGSQAAIYNALVTIFEQIMAANSTFASASLPVNATNRAQDKNQVYVPMFRPDTKLQPRWFGNLKQYQLINSGGAIQLGDAASAPAINLLTGYPTACAQSFWSSDSTDAHYPTGYFNYAQSQNASLMWNTTSESQYAKGTCPTSALSPWADLPDGPAVEKGGVAEVIRKGNNPPTTNTTPTWSPAQRNVKTINANAGNLVPFDTAHTGLNASMVNWMLGQDVQDENGNGNTAETRPSVHGDEIHSRPLPVDYGSGVTRVFYGSNDGTLRAVDGLSGQELWAFVAPEFYNPLPSIYVPGASPVVTPTGLERLMWSNMTDATGNQISPIINYYGTPQTITPTPKAKDYFFDGAIGIYEGALTAQGAPSAVWIYPSMRRGGRMIYAMDVTTATSPSVLWKFGCPHLNDDLLCVGGGNVTSIGQTWSMPAAAASVQGYSSPVVIVGGGYDACEDANTATPACATPKGAGVYVLDAQSGTQVKFFPTTRSVAADIALIAVSMAGMVEHAYVADTGGNIYRIDFGAGANQSQWVMNKVAYTNGSGRKFLFAPSLLAAPPGNQVYVAIGSGDREHPLQAEYPYPGGTDIHLTPNPNPGVINRFYVFKDNLSSTSALNLDDTSKMFDYTLGPGGATNGTTCNSTSVLPASAMSGWFMSLTANGQGEQTVTSALIAAGMVAFSTNRPIPSSQGTCQTVLGAAYGYWVNLFNASGAINANGATCGGSRDSPFVGGGLPPSPVIASVPVDGHVVEAVIGAAQLSGGTSCGICPQQVQPAITPTRHTIFWKASGEN